jgi:hypothetical protein
MKRLFSLFAIIIALTFSSVAKAQGTNQPVLGNGTILQYTVGATPVTIVIFDTSRFKWIIHPEGGTIRCEPGLINGQVPGITPSSSVGFEFVSNGYFDSTLYVSPVVIISCVAESSSVPVSVWNVYRQ